MQHASGLMAVDEGGGGGGKPRKTAYSYMGDDEDERWAGIDIICMLIHNKLRKEL